MAAAGLFRRVQHAKDILVVKEQRELYDTDCDPLLPDGWVVRRPTSDSSKRYFVYGGVHSQWVHPHVRIIKFANDGFSCSRSCPLCRKATP